WMYPPEEVTMQTVRELQPRADTLFFFLSLAGYAMLGWQIAIPFFAFRRRGRLVLLTGAAVAWLGAVTIFHLPYFGPVTVIGCLSYLTPAEWSWALSWLRPSRAAEVEEAPRPTTVPKFRP